MERSEIKQELQRMYDIYLSLYYKLTNDCSLSTTQGNTISSAFDGGGISVCKLVLQDLQDLIDRV